MLTMLYPLVLYKQQLYKAHYYTKRRSLYLDTLKADKWHENIVADPEGVQGVRSNSRPVLKYPMKMK